MLMSEIYAKEMQEYEDNMWDKEIGRPARHYLKSRHISPQTAKYWHIGYCPYNFVPKCYNNVKYRQYEKMQGRLILPVFGQNGDVIAMSGRTIDGTKPKYMHYSFPTRKIMFGLWQNRREIFQQNAIIFVEGQLDVITAWQHGLRLCACTFGAHFSPDNIALAARYCDRVYILYDADEAGRNGVQQSLQKLPIKGDMRIRVIKYVLQEGEDVDSYLQTNGLQKIMNSINYTQLEGLRNKIKRMS